MKKRIMISFIAFFLSFSSCIYLNGTIYAEESDIKDNNREEVLDSSSDENQIPDYDTSGYEAWLPDFNPRARGFSSGYTRNGNFILGYDNGSVQNASSFKVSWSGGGTVQDYNVNGTYVRRNDNIMTIREYAETNGTITVKRNCSEHNSPFFGSLFRNGKTLPAGTYTVTKESLEFVEVAKPDGSRAWITPQYSDDGGTYYAQNYAVMNSSKVSLNASSVNGIPIKQKMMPIREDKRTGITMQPKYVTIHNTANAGVGASAAAHANLQMNDSRQWVSWHYTVDNIEAYQSIPMNEVAYHAGDGTYLGNSATIGIEICENADGNYAKAEMNAAYLTAQILFENGMPSDAVRMHKDWSGKNCAHNIIEGTKGTMGWTAFMNLVKQEYDRLQALNNLNTTVPEPFKAMMDNSGYKFNGGYVSGFLIDSSIQGMIDKLKSLDGAITVTSTKGGATLAPDRKLETGQLITVSKGTARFNFMTVISGDTNGDGKISSLDYAYVKNDILKISALASAYRNAGDINRDGKISSMDYVYIKNHILNIKKIEQ